MQLAIAVLNQYRDNVTLAGVLLSRALLQRLAVSLTMMRVNGGGGGA
jgi:hypothetical protein